MLYLELPPPPALSSVVRCFWFLRNDLADGTTQPVVADGRLEIVLHAAEPFSRVIDGRLSLQDDALLAGQLTAPLYLRQLGPADVVGIRFRTSAATALIDHPIHELTNEVASLGGCNRRLRDDLLLALAQSTDPFRRRDLLSAVLLRHIQQEPDALTTVAVRLLDQPRPPDLRAIAARLNTTSRTLERRILAATGLTPTALRQTMRFRRVFRSLQEAGTGAMTAVGLDAGYYDQAHCIREFRRFTAQAPSAFFAGEQALASALVASVQSPRQTA